MKRFALILCFALAACATPEQIAAEKQRQLQEDTNNCMSYGFRPNSDGFRNCLLQIDLARQQRNSYYHDPHPYLYTGFYHHR